MWNCPLCDTSNEDSDIICVVCGEGVRPSLGVSSLNEVRELSDSAIKQKLEEKLESLAWSEIDLKNEDDLKKFLSLFPTGIHVPEATLRLSNIIEAERREEEEDHRYYTQARHSQSPIDYRFYINRFPAGHHIDEAKSWMRAYWERLDDEEWSKAKRINTINSYRQYLERPTNERYRTEAQRLVDKLEDEVDWSFAVKANTYAAYLAYQRNHPMGSHKADCSAHIAVFEDDRDWLGATNASTLSIYEEYLLKHPNGKHSAEAQERIIEFRDDNKWNYAVNFDTVFAYSLYKSDYPKGRHIEECEKRLRYLTEEAMWERCVSSDTIASYQDYLNSYSQGRYIDAARNAIRLIRDDEDWRSAQKEKTIKANRRYLEKYGKSARHAEEARNAISELKFGNNRWILAMSVVIVCFLIAWFVITHIDAMQTTSSAPQHQAFGPVVNNTREINRLKMEIEAILKDKEQIVKEGNAPGLLTPVENLINQLEQYQDSDVERYKRRLEQLKNKR